MILFFIVNHFFSVSTKISAAAVDEMPEDDDITRPSNFVVFSYWSGGGSEASWGQVSTEFGVSERLIGITDNFCGNSVF